MVSFVLVSAMLLLFDPLSPSGAHGIMVLFGDCGLIYFGLGEMLRPGAVVIKFVEAFTW